MAALLDFTIKSTALLGAGLLLIPLMRRASASSRHAIWTSVFCGIALLPLAASALPTLPIPVLAAPASPTVSYFPQPQPQPQPLATVTLRPRSDVGSSADRSIAAGHGQKRTTLPINDVVVGLWLAGLCLLMARMVVGAIDVRRLSRRAQPAPNADVTALVDRARGVLGVRRRIVVLSIADDVMPVTWGLWRPVVLLPASAQPSERPSGIEAVILHEVAHVARLDVISQLISQLVTAALWFHPLAWMAQRAARLERERACDDAALRHGSRPSEYAMELLMLVRALRPFGPMSLGTLGAASRSHLDRRIRDILDRRVNRAGASIASLVTAVALVGASAPVAAMHLTRRASPPPPRPALTVARAAGAAAATFALHVEPFTSLRAAPRLQLRRATQPIAVQDTTQAEIPWQAERGGMYEQLIEIAQHLVDSCHTQVQIGTMAQIDVQAVEQTLETLTDLARRDAASQEVPPSPTERADIRARFGAATRLLDVDREKFSVGLLRLAQYDSDLLDAANLLHVRRTPATSDASPAGETLSFALALEAAAHAAGSDHDRADAFLAIAKRTVFTPEMVSQFVDAVSHLSPAERDRVLAEPIRVKAAGGG